MEIIRTTFVITIPDWEQSLRNNWCMTRGMGLTEAGVVKCTNILEKTMTVLYHSSYASLWLDIEWIKTEYCICQLSGVWKLPPTLCIYHWLELESGSHCIQYVL